MTTHTQRQDHTQRKDHDVPEPSLHDQLLADYDRHEDAIDQAALTELWALGDWLAKYVPNNGDGCPPKTVTRVTVSLDDLAGRRGRSRSWLSSLRKAAEVTSPDRLPQITPRVYMEVLRSAGWDLMEANHRLVTKGHRLRDHAGPMESVDLLKRQLGKRTPEERAAVVRELMADSTVAELLDGLDPASFGSEWADLPIARVHEAAAKLHARVTREGLRLSPGSDLAEFLDLLLESEHRIAEIRAAVQERITDAGLEVGDAH